MFVSVEVLRNTIGLLLSQINNTSNNGTMKVLGNISIGMNCVTEGKNLSAIFVEKETGCGNANADDVCPLRHSSRWTFLVAPLQRKMMNQNLTGSGQFSNSNALRGHSK